MMTINDLTFGVELEVVLPLGVSHATCADRISAAGVACRTALRLSHVPTWKVVGDISIRGGNGAEIVSPVLKGDDGFAQLRKVCDALVAMGATVNTTCGFHVHVGARHATVDFFKNLGKTYAKFEPVIDSLLSPSRRGNANHYCKGLRLQHDEIDRAIDVRGVGRAIGAGSGDDRYMKLNLAAWFRHGTVEFRQHQGTVDAEKAINWTRLCLRMCVAAMTQTTATAAAFPVRLGGRDRHLNMVVEMLLRSEGTTRAEVMAATGQRGARLPRRIAAAGLIVVKRRRNGEVRFYGRRPAPVEQDTVPVTVDGLMAVVAATTDEHQYFARRATVLARVA